MTMLFLLLGVLICSTAVRSTDEDIDELSDFPKAFMFGVASAAYQVEGAWNLSGKGENIWDRFTHESPHKIEDGSNADIACDSYHLYKEDVALIKELGVNVYRFSISWSRLIPSYGSSVNPDGVRYYNDLLDELLQHGIEPMVTIYHYDLPQYLEDLGGWLFPGISDEFGNYARTAYELFGDKVKWWLTINEPNYVAFGYGVLDNMAPAVNLSGIGEYQAVHNMLRAHAKAYRIYEKEFKEKQKGKVSIVLSGTYHIPANENDPIHVEAAERLNQFTFGWVANPIYSEKGDYPPVMREYIDRHCKEEGRDESRLPHFTPVEIEDIKGAYDFMALNHYITMLAFPMLYGPVPSYYRDQEAIPLPINEALDTDCGIYWKQYPEGLRGVLNFLRTNYNNPEILIAENGYCGKGGLNDIQRIDFHKRFLRSLLSAINEDKCNIFGYIFWSLTDNFEWSSGYTKRFGLVEVDFDSPERERKMKQSAYFVKELMDKYNTKQGQRKPSSFPKSGHTEL